ncbi:MAG: hypothetical protein M1368_00500 [Thaumarchaeota archaeon]|nr:hypothetical protein [Nitrososphaerota archaeon]
MIASTTTLLVRTQANEFLALLCGGLLFTNAMKDIQSQNLELLACLIAEICVLFIRHTGRFPDDRIKHRTLPSHLPDVLGSD